MELYIPQGVLDPPYAEFETFLLSSVMFALIYLVSYFVIFRSWKGVKRADAASCCMSFIHAVTTTIFAGREVLTQPWDLAAPNTRQQDRIMEFSTAYFFIDTIHLAFLSPDPLFVIHHCATSIYMMSCRLFARYGAMSVMALIAAGEATSPIQNIWTVARLGKEYHPLFGSLYQWLSPPFTLYFTAVRGVFGPWLLYTLAAFYLTGKADKVLPRWLAVAWVLVATTALLGSVVWVIQLWRGLLKFYARRRQPAKKVQ